MECQICYQEVSGEITVSDMTLPGGIGIISLAATPDRDWIACDACGRIVCHSCCRHPETGYCDTCIEKYDLLIAEEDSFGSGEDQTAD